MYPKLTLCLRTYSRYLSSTGWTHVLLRYAVSRDLSRIWLPLTLSISCKLHYPLHTDVFSGSVLSYVEIASITSRTLTLLQPKTHDKYSRVLKVWFQFSTLSSAKTAPFIAGISHVTEILHPRLFTPMSKSNIANDKISVVWQRRSLVTCYETHKCLCSLQWFPLIASALSFGFNLFNWKWKM